MEDTSQKTKDTKQKQGSKNTKQRGPGPDLVPTDGVGMEQPKTRTKTTAATNHVPVSSKSDDAPKTRTSRPSRHSAKSRHSKEKNGLDNSIEQEEKNRTSSSTHRSSNKSERSGTLSARERRREQDLRYNDDGYNKGSSDEYYDDDDFDDKPGACPVPGMCDDSQEDVNNERSNHGGMSAPRQDSTPILMATLVDEEALVQRRQDDNDDNKIIVTAQPMTLKSALCGNGNGGRVCIIVTILLFAVLGISLGVGLALGRNNPTTTAVVEENQQNDDDQKENNNNETITLTPNPTPAPTVFGLSAPSGPLPTLGPTLAPTHSPEPTSSPTFEPIDPSRATWIPIGGDLNGRDRSGAAVSLSSDGQLLAVGNIAEPYIQGEVKVYQRFENLAWTSISSISSVDSTTDDGCCTSIALSDDGTTLAIGSPLSDQAGTDYGQVQVYRFNQNSGSPGWVPLGDPILGLTAGVSFAPGERFGASVSLSSDGNILAVGAPQVDGNDGATFGEVRVYKFDETLVEWVRRGQSLDDAGCYEYGEFGSSVSLSSDGNVLAVGAPEYDSPYDHAGLVQVFKYDEQTELWERLGDAFPGEGRLNRFGTSVALSANGRTVAIGGPGNDPEETTFEGAGHVRVYRLLFGGFWSQIGQDIDGKLDNGVLGTSVAISDDGDIIAVGAPGNGTGYAQVYYLNEGGSWEQIGSDLVGEQNGDAFGTSISLSGSGRVVAVGAPNNQEGRNNPNGHVRVFRLDHQD